MMAVQVLLQRATLLGATDETQHKQPHDVQQAIGYSTFSPARFPHPPARPTSVFDWT